MRRFIPVEILMKETDELQKSVAADLQVPDPVPSNIIAKKSKKSTSGEEKVENPQEYDRGTGSLDDNQSVPATGK